MTVSDWAYLESDLRLPNGTLRGREIGKRCPLDRRRRRGCPPRRTLPMIEKRMSDDVRLPPGGGRRRTLEPARAQLVQAFLGSFLIVFISR
jgi:hypothetical protein